MYRILTLNPIAAVGLNQFPHQSYEIGPDITQPDGILVRSQDMHTMNLPSSLKVIGRAGAGVNNIPVAEMTKLGIPVMNTPGANANAVRELVIAGMLLASRNICQAWNYLEDLEASDKEMQQRIEKDKKQFVGFEIMGKTLGVIGLGSVGVKVANAAISLGMRVIGYDPTITVMRAWELSSEVKKAQSIDDLLIESDFVTFHVPLNEETKNMINVSRFHLMKKNVVLLNFAREGIIDKDALMHALKEKTILNYVTDFPNPSIKSFPQVICLPHLGASTREAEENCAEMIAKQMRDFFEKGTIINSVNFPTIDMPRSQSGFRLAIVNRNIPNMVAQFSSKLAEAGLNILSLQNQSRDEIAYTLIDLDSEMSEQVMKQIAAIEGVVQVRQI